MNKFVFNPEDAYIKIKNQWTKWADKTGAKGYVVGISGGKDSTVVGALAAKIFGSNSIVGVSLSNSPIGFAEAKDEAFDAEDLCSDIGIERFYNININAAFNSIINQLDAQCCDIYGTKISVSKDTKINLPARLRMSTLYAVAQTLGYRVLNTCNLSEDMVGYSTLFGDTAGSFSPISDLTATEVVQLGKWLGVPDRYINRTPTDGLCGQTDEEKLGFSYAQLDNFIRNDIGTEEFKQDIRNRYSANKFKLDIIQLPKVNLAYPNFVVEPVFPISTQKAPLQRLRKIICEPKYTAILESMMDYYNVNGLKDLTKEEIEEFISPILRGAENAK